MQDELPFDIPEAQKPKRRPRRKRPVPSTKHVPTQLSMFRVPDLTKCGFCGAAVTVLEEVAACPGCGGIVSRPQPDDFDD